MTYFIGIYLLLAAIFSICYLIDVHNRHIQSLTPPKEIKCDIVEFKPGKYKIRIHFVGGSSKDYRDPGHSGEHGYDGYLHTYETIAEAEADCIKLEQKQQRLIAAFYHKERIVERGDK